MGEIADMMLDGTLCQMCGVLLNDDGEAAGFPTTCEGCLRAMRRDHGPRPAPVPLVCTCGKSFGSKNAMEQHVAARRRNGTHP